MRVLAWAVRTPARYIGMIGSKRKVLSVYKALETEGYRPKNSSAFSRPWTRNRRALAGKIAISIVAELIAVRRNAESAAHKKVGIESRLASAR